MSLSTYRAKRDFERTREPRGRQSRRKGHAFVVQKHDARRLHYDFRLELGGVFLSWALPKGPTLDPDVKRLAMQTEDHPLDYGDFEGVIPAGEYGGGTVLVWDRGTWQPDGDAESMYRRGRLTFELHGDKLHGRFHLVRAGGRGGKQGERSWLLFKSRDDAARPGEGDQILQAQPRSVASGRDLPAIAADPDHVWTSRAPETRAGRATAKSRVGRIAKAPAGPSLDALAKRPGVVRAALPAFVEPQLATLVGEAPEGDAWLHEVKLDGYRILARLERGHARLFSRRGSDWTSRLPSVASALDQLRIDSGWLDGELVVLAKNGVSDFQTLQNSLEAGRDVACTYFVFDLPFFAGFDLRHAPLLERKELLGELLAGAGRERLRLSQHLRGAGAALFERAAALGLEGIVSKRADAPYTSGRGRAWLKVKSLSRQEFVIGGYTEPVGARGPLGALLLGVREGERLSYAGKVGTGFTRASLEQLAARLAPLEQPEPPFSNPPRGAERRGVHWVRPGLVAEVAFTERTQGGLIRHGSFQGLREDKAPDEVRLEAPETTAATSPPPAIALDPARFEVTHPDRVLFPEQGITKRELMIYYARVARRMLPHVVERPLMLVRCPEGAGADCFHQKHPSRGMPRAVEQVTIAGKKKPEPSLVIRDVEGLIGLVQMGALEIHTWGSRVSRVEYPDQLVFDLDPDEGLPWARVVEAAHSLEALLRARGLTGFLRLTGGKGLHIVVPVLPEATWDEVKRFTRGVAEALVAAEPSRYVATMTKQKRRGKIFIDYFRNGRGATAVCAYSTRARPGAPIALPIGWHELEEGALGAEPIEVKNIERRLAAHRDPWAGFDEARAPLRG